MTSLWLSDRVEPPWSASRLEDGPRSADIIVVGAGITGLMTAVLLARAGKEVLVLEARTVGAGTTGNTTAKISLLQGTHMTKILAKHGKDLARAYVEGNREGQDWVINHCETHGVAVQREDAYTYAQSAKGVPSAKAELKACQAVGLPVEWSDDAGVPFPYHGGVRLPEQAQFDPMPFLDTLAEEFTDRGGRLVEHARVRRVSWRGDKLRVYVNDAAQREVELETGRLVLATGIPILDRGGFFARLQPSRSYCLAYRVPGEITRPMMISTDSPTRSVRYAPAADGERLIVGGASHTVGRSRSPSKDLEELSSWTRQHYPGAEQTHFWSAQDYTPIDDLPYVGPILPNNESIFVATGFNKWGMTNGAAAALALSSRILGGRMDWSRAFASWSAHELSGVFTAMQFNAEVGFDLAKGWVTPATRIGRRGPGPDEGGVVSGPPWHLQARCRVDGTEHRVSPVCTHLGGIVNWNDADKAWECPLHGSRFAPDGTLLEGPATRDLTKSS
ncbi:FAD-dependent oxidoreductase [Mycobacterium saskatchewanense]|uniref:FAD-dependent oxidoreductase n=1 Tax=Mycobacterium saskatchewanense TaxID=220927 RepID=A0AAJ3TTR8_9MYCO|nr:FAD-dependent oxidoreductase [Mycobacterium saskatchewanense]ORW69028.1 FAD-dependent oxidoreductase [Mycobacterium saskatchewanense]BBX61677.1 FAD-dependent oxidoreductase [Mycobacterium saskatchewanense]